MRSRHHCAFPQVISVDGTKHTARVSGGALPMNFPRISLSTAADGTLYFYKYVSFSSDLLYLIIREIVGRSSGSMAPIDFFKPSYMVQCPPRWCYRDHKTACSNPGYDSSGFSAVTQTSKAIEITSTLLLWFMVAKYLPYYLTSPPSFNVSIFSLLSPHSQICVHWLLYDLRFPALNMRLHD